jgi:hypothetical protein
MKSFCARVAGVCVIAFAVYGCATGPSQGAESGWVTLFDGTNMNAFDKVGDANWRIVDGVLQADKLGETEISFLVSKSTYSDFEIRAEFWVSEDANSGIFLRVSDRRNLTTENAYEVNIFDERPDPSYGTGAIVDVAKVVPMPRAGSRWNTYDITAKGPRLIVVLNGTQTVDVEDRRLRSGPIALQYGSGVVKFRKVQIRPL